jgi:hypothetical protein
MLILADGGGNNSSRHFVFKSELEKLANEFFIENPYAHYPSYCSKWNPVEQRVFPHLTRAMQGVILTSHELAQALFERATTRTGLKAIVNIIDTFTKPDARSLLTIKIPCALFLMITWAGGAIEPYQR